MKVFINIEKELSDQGRELSQRIVDLLPKATGELAKSIQYKLNEEGAVISMEIETADYFKFVDEGRSSGKFPPISEIQEWTRKRNIPIEASFAIAKKIAEEGTQGLNITQQVQPTETSSGAGLEIAAAKDLDSMYEELIQEIFK